MSATASLRGSGLSALVSMASRRASSVGCPSARKYSNRLVIMMMSPVVAYLRSPAAFDEYERSMIFSRLTMSLTAFELRSSSDSSEAILISG